jgi:hypothetical protein
MTATLSNVAPVSTEHHQRLIRHVDQMPRIAELMDSGTLEEFRAALDEAGDFLAELLVPHMEAAERALFPELERMMQNRHSTVPLRREHEQIRASIDDLARLRGLADLGTLSMNEKVALRRIVFRLYSLLKIHMAEELLYAELVEHGASPEAEKALAAAMEHSGTGRFE